MRGNNHAKAAFINKEVEGMSLVCIAMQPEIYLHVRILQKDSEPIHVVLEGNPTESQILQPQENH